MQFPDTEEWRPVPIPEYAEIYEVSNHGRVRRTKTLVRRGGYGRVPAGRFLKPYRVKGRYLVASFMIDGRRKVEYIHRLVLKAFVGPPPEGTEACHCDGDFDNNHISNLRWDSHLENLRDSVRHGNSTVGTRNAQAKLTEDDVRKIRALYAGGVSQGKLGKQFGVAQTAIFHVVNRRTWRHI